MMAKSHWTAFHFTPFNRNTCKEVEMINEFYFACTFKTQAVMYIFLNIRTHNGTHGPQWKGMFFQHPGPDLFQTEPLLARRALKKSQRAACVHKEPTCFSWAGQITQMVAAHKWYINIMGVVEVSLTRLNCIAENMTDRMKRLHSDALSLDCLCTSPLALGKPNKDMVGGSRPRNALALALPAWARPPSREQHFVF